MAQFDEMQLDFSDYSDEFAASLLKELIKARDYRTFRFGRSSSEGGGPRGRAREKVPHHLEQNRMTRSRVPPTVAPGNRGRPNGPRASPHESRPPALSRHGSGRRTLLVVCPPSPPRPPSPRQASPPTSAEGRASTLVLPLHDWFAPFQQAQSRDRAATTLKDDFHLNAEVDSQPPPPGTGKETAVTTETPGTPERRKRSWKFRSWRLETTVSFYGTSFASPTRVFVDRRVPPPRTSLGPPLPTYPRPLSLRPLSLLRHLASILRSVTAWRTLARSPGFRPIGNSDGSRGTRAIRHGVPRRSVGLSIKSPRLRVTVVMSAWLFPHSDL